VVLGLAVELALAETAALAVELKLRKGESEGVGDTDTEKLEVGEAAEDALAALGGLGEALGQPEALIVTPWMMLAEAEKDALAHEQPNPRNEPGHVVKVARGTQLHGIVGAEELQVNSAHHQAAADSPEGIVVNATAPDGVIEGIEAPAYRFCIGVQWHPEFLISEGDAKLFRAFLGAAGTK
jgi:gamma-glutamyl-gamma-aminobutyrate hydrolase PuuD